jgi:MFS family permease
VIEVLALVVACVAAVRGAWSPCGLSVLSSLNPVSERARGHRFRVTAAWYVAGAAVGGALLGAACAVPAAVVGRLGLPGPFTWATALAGAVVAVVSDSRVLGWSLPDHPRQLDERWLVTYRRWIYAGGFGVQIGTGFATYIMTAAVYLTALLAVLTGSPTTALAVGLLFGTVRGLTVLVAAPATTPGRLRALLARVDRFDATSLLVAMVACAAVAVVAAGLLGGAVAAGATAAGLGSLLGARGRAGHRQPDQPRDHEGDVQHAGHLLHHHQ